MKEIVAEVERRTLTSTNAFYLFIQSLLSFLFLKYFMKHLSKVNKKRQRNHSSLILISLKQTVSFEFVACIDAR